MDAACRTPKGKAKEEKKATKATAAKKATETKATTTKKATNTKKATAGEPVVTDDGDILYVFQDLMATATSPATGERSTRLLLLAEKLDRLVGAAEQAEEDRKAEKTIDDVRSSATLAKMVYYGPGGPCDGSWYATILQEGTFDDWFTISDWRPNGPFESRKIAIQSLGSIDAWSDDDDTNTQLKQFKDGDVDVVVFNDARVFVWRY